MRILVGIYFMGFIMFGCSRSDCILINPIQWIEKIDELNSSLGIGDVVARDYCGEQIRVKVLQFVYSDNQKDKIGIHFVGVQQ